MLCPMKLLVLLKSVRSRRAKDAPQRHALLTVSTDRARGMRADNIDLLRRQARLAASASCMHSACRSGIGQHEIGGVGVHRVADDLAVDPRTAACARRAVVPARTRSPLRPPRCRCDACRTDARLASDPRARPTHPDCENWQRSQTCECSPTRRPPSATSHSSNRSICMPWISPALPAAQAAPIV